MAEVAGEAPTAHSGNIRGAGEVEEEEEVCLMCETGAMGYPFVFTEAPDVHSELEAILEGKGVQPVLMDINKQVYRDVFDMIIQKHTEEYTLPVVVMNRKLIGDVAALRELDDKGELDAVVEDVERVRRSMEQHRADMREEEARVLQNKAPSARDLQLLGARDLIPDVHHAATLVATLCSTVGCPQRGIASYAERCGGGGGGGGRGGGKRACFCGRTFVDWMMQRNFVVTRSSACDLGDELVRRGLLRVRGGPHGAFQDSEEQVLSWHAPQSPLSRCFSCAC